MAAKFDCNTFYTQKQLNIPDNCMVLCCRYLIGYVEGAEAATAAATAVENAGNGGGEGEISQVLFVFVF
jgi:hypothetical protein